MAVAVVSSGLHNTDFGGFWRLEKQDTEILVFIHIVHFGGKWLLEKGRPEGHRGTLHLRTPILAAFGG